MNKPLVALLLALLEFNTIPVRAEPSAPRPLSLEDAIVLALTRRLDMRMEQKNVEAAQAHVDEARSWFLPTLDLRVTNQHINTYDTFSGLHVNAQFGGMAIPVEVKREVPRNQLLTGIELNYNLYAGGVHEAGLDDARSQFDSAKVQESIARQRVLFEVTQAAAEVYKAQIEHDRALRAVEYARTDSVTAKHRLDNGELARIDYENKRITLSAKEIEARSRGRALDEASRRLKVAIGGDSQEEPVSVEFTADDLQLQKLIRRYAPDRWLEHIKARSELESKLARLRAAKAAEHPVVDVFVGYSGIGRSDGDLADTWRRHKGEASLIGVRLTWNLFDGFRTRSHYAQAQSEVARAQLRMDEVRRELNNSLESKALRAADLHDQLVLAQHQLALALAQQEIARVRLETGAISAIQQHYSARLAASEAQDRVDVLQVDLFLARLVYALAQP